MLSVLVLGSIAFKAHQSVDRRNSIHVGDSNDLQDRCCLQRRLGIQQQVNASIAIQWNIRNR